MTTSLPFLDAATVRRLVPPRAAVRALQDALRSGLRPEQDAPRVAAPLAHGEFLLMPSEAAADAGVKVLTVAPGNPVRGLPRIQGLYILFDAETLTPRVLIDGPALTDLRTPAVSIAAVEPLLRRRQVPLRVVLYGAGHQGRGHLATLRDTLGDERIAHVTTVTRDPSRVATGDGIDHAAASGSPTAEEETRAADLIICSTTARTPLFRGDLVRDDAVVIAVGSHEPTARELDAPLLGRSTVVVEDRATALRECGDVVLAIDEGALDTDDLLTMSDVLDPETRLAADAPVVFKSSGMSWEDLVVASAVWRAARDEDDGR
ncbi:ornithine cyclodeaminase family protein [Microbacterium sp. G2-8]|uniref:ornithine cyclodeaminase family protein n=1 Tax=Microbacterium sp. G2-8 TaxID=2842454 RepID=UPI001C8A0764|nr:ornithine cyclodeaminase family protein [Microbacterium sp. G2-8]